MTVGQPNRGSHTLLILLVLIWGASWPVTKIGVTAVTPIWFACLRYVVATVCLVVVVGLRGELALPSRSDLKLVTVSGILQMASYSALTAVALTRLPPGRSSILAYSTPLWVVPLSAWRLREQMSWHGYLGVGAGLMGILIIASPGLRPTTTDYLMPYALLMLAAAGWAISIVFVRGHRFQASALALAPWQMMMAAMLLMPFAIAVEGAVPVMNRRGLASLAYVAPVATAFAYWAVVEVGRHVRAMTISVALQAVPCVGLIISAIAFHEPVTAPLVFGVTLISVGVLLATARTPLKWRSLPCRDAARNPKSQQHGKDDLVAQRLQ
jgi:drug/metabolite transporter (DMT)-like permease